MAGDWFSARVVLFGGFGSTGALNDTWEWDGTGWTQHTTTQQPRAGSHAMAWDPAGGGTLLFGAGSSGPETWKWNGATWTRILPAHTPSARAAHAMATDLRRRCVVLYGGNDGVSNLGDTWEWNGTDWIQATPAVNPNVRAYHAMAYLPSRSRVVLFGGANAATGTWEWDGTQWTLSPATWPAGEVVPRRRHCLALEPDRGTVLLTGGQFDSSSTSMAQGTLRYGPLTTAATSLLGAGCGGPNGAPVLTAGEPYLGCPNAAIQISAAPPHAIGVLGLSFVAERLHLDGRCTLYLGTLAAIRVLSTDAAGSAVCPLAVPATPSLRGIAFHAQAAVSDPQGPVAGWSLTAARTMVVGD